MVSERPSLSRGELDVARHRWVIGLAGVRQVHEVVSRDRGMDFSTVQTYLRRLESKMYASFRLDRHARLWVWPLMLLGCAIVLPGAGVVSAQNSKGVQVSEPDQRASEPARPRVLPNPAAEQGEQYGFAPVRIEACLILVPTERWSDLGIQWQPMGQERAQRMEPLEQSGSDAIGPHDARVLPPIAALPRFAQAWTSPPHPAQPSGSSQTASQPAVRQVRARTILERSNVMDLAILDDDPTRQLLASVAGARVLSMPQVITTNGRSATIEVGRKEQVLTGYKTDRDGNRLEPMREEVSVGTRMMLLPVVVDDRYVELELDLSVTRFLDPGNGSSSSDSQTAPSIRTLASSRIETKCHVPLAATLAIGGLEVVEDGIPHRLLCLLRCDFAYDEADGPTTEPPSASGTKQDEAINGLDSLSITAGDGDPALGTLTSSFDLLGKRGVKVTLHGNMRAQKSNDQTTLQIQPIQIDWVDGDRITANQAEIRITEEKPATAQLQGNVSLVLGNRKFRADDAKIKGDTLLLTGNVQVTTENMTMSTDQLQMSVGHIGRGD